LAQSAVTPASVSIMPGYTGKIGLAAVNADNASAPYFEYRPQYLQYGTTGVGGAGTVTINGGAGGSKVDQGSAPAAWDGAKPAQRWGRATGSGLTWPQRLKNGTPAVLLKGPNAANALNVNRGDVGVAFFGGETATLVTVNVGYETNPAGDSTVWLGPGVGLAN